MRPRESTNVTGLALALLRLRHELQLERPEALGLGVIRRPGLHVDFRAAHGTLAARGVDVERRVQALLAE